MDYWQTIELIKQDWGMGHPVAYKEARSNVIALIDDIGSYIDEYDTPWLEYNDLKMVASSGKIDFHKRDAVCQIRQGPSGKLVVNRKIMEPKEYNFSLEFYERIIREIEKWAVSVS